jgi:hypothetical protein
MKSTILSLYVALALFNVCACRDHKQNPSGNLAFENEIQLSWKINSTKRTIRFKINAAVDESGWFLIGFEPLKKGEVPKSIKDTRGDAFVVWRQAVNKTYTTWTVTVRIGKKIMIFTSGWE